MRISDWSSGVCSSDLRNFGNDENFGSAGLIVGKVGTNIGPLAIIACGGCEADPITLIVEIDAAFPVGDKIFQFQQPLAITRDQRPGPGDLILGIIGVGAERCLAAEHIKSISQDRIDTLRAAVEGIAEELDRAEITAARNSCRYQLGSLRRGQRKTSGKSNAFIDLDIEIIEREGQSDRKSTRLNSSH